MATDEMISSSKSRTVKQSFLSVEQSEGMNSRVRRSIGRPELGSFDPFLLLDEFCGEGGNSGFPDHPHRGFETVSYIIEGSFSHEDFIGNAGTLYSGDLQWMTAGRGIVHSEMPDINSGLCRGLQLWVNLPAKEKMCEPTYQELKSVNIPQVEKNGVNVRVIAGKSMGIDAKVYTKTQIYYLDFKLASGNEFFQEIPQNWNAMVYILNGRGLFGPPGSGKETASHYTLEFNQNGDGIYFKNSREEELHFVLIAGKPIGEPVKQYGPFVMTTDEELKQAILDYRTGKNGFENAPGWKSKNGQTLLASLAK